MFPKSLSTNYSSTTKFHTRQFNKSMENQVILCPPMKHLLGLSSWFKDLKDDNDIDAINLFNTMLDLLPVDPIDLEKGLDRLKYHVSSLEDDDSVYLHVAGGLGIFKQQGVDIVKGSIGGLIQDKKGNILGFPFYGLITKKDLVENEVSALDMECIAARFGVMMLCLVGDKLGKKDFVVELKMEAKEAIAMIVGDVTDPFMIHVYPNMSTTCMYSNQAINFTQYLLKIIPNHVEKVDNARANNLVNKGYDLLVPMIKFFE